MRITHKFALVGLLFMTPLAVVLIPSLAREAHIVEHSISDRNDLSLTRQAWSALATLGTPEARGAFDRLNASIATAADHHVRSADQVIIQLRDPHTNLSATSDALLDAIADFGDRIKIKEIVDPTTYYLSEIATKRLPRILAELRRDAIGYDHDSADRPKLLRRSVAVADLKWSRSARSLESLRRVEPSFADELQADALALDRALRDWGASPDDVALARAAEAQAVALFHRCALLLDKALDDRARTARARAAAMAAGTGIALSLAVAVLCAVSRSVRRSVTTLRDTTARLEAGDYDARVRAWSADELADVAAAFNRIVSQLRAHRDDALAESRTRAAAEAQATQSLQRLLQMADAMPAVVFETDAQGQPTFLSAGWEQLTGTSPVGCTHGTWLDLIHPADRADADAAFSEAIARQRPHAVRYRIRRADGSHRWTLETSRPRFDARGAYLGTVGCMIDIHEQIEASEALDSERLRLQTACSGAGIGVWELHMPSRTLAWSDLMFGLLRSDPARFMGTLDDLIACVDPADLPAIHSEIDRTLATGTPGSIRFRLADCSGGRRTIAGSWIVVPDATGHRLIGVNWDMTDQLESSRRLERQARDLAEARDAAQAASSAKSEFLANMSHEIRTPIAAIVGYAELLLDDHLDADSAPSRSSATASTCSAWSTTSSISPRSRPAA